MLESAIVFSSDREAFLYVAESCNHVADDGEPVRWDDHLHKPALEGGDRYCGPCVAWRHLAHNDLVTWRCVSETTGEAFEGENPKSLLGSMAAAGGAWKIGQDD